MVEELALSVSESPKATDLDRLRRGLTEHSRAFVDREGFRPLAVFARTAGGELVGGAYGLVNWAWLDLSLLWVAPEYRGRGLGSRLLRAIEAAARTRGCQRAHVETFSYQAVEFYRRHRFEVFAELAEYPPGQSKSFLKKKLHRYNPPHER